MGIRDTALSERMMDCSCDGRKRSSIILEMVRGHTSNKPQYATAGGHYQPETELLVQRTPLTVTVVANPSMQLETGAVSKKHYVVSATAKGITPKKKFQDSRCHFKRAQPGHGVRGSDESHWAHFVDSYSASGKEVPFKLR